MSTDAQSTTCSASSDDASSPSSEAAKALWSEKKQDLVSKLVQLRIKQQDMKENPSLEDIDSKKILGHKFQRLVARNCWWRRNCRLFVFFVSPGFVSLALFSSRLFISSIPPFLPNLSVSYYIFFLYFFPDVSRPLRPWLPPILAA